MTTQSGEPAAAWKKHLLDVAALAWAVLFAGKHLANLPARGNSVALDWRVLGEP